MRFRHFFPAVFCLSVLAMARAAEVIAPPPELAPVREVIVQSMQDRIAPSIAVAVVRNGAIVWLEAFGEADVANHIAATPDTPYPLTSCTQALTAFAMLELRERGLVDLDKPANTYLGEGTLRAAIGKAEDITPRRLLNHTAGFARFTSYYFPPVAPSPAKEMIARYGQAVIAPGSAFEYSNLGYLAAASVMEKTADMPWAQFMRDNIFKPMGMGHSGAEPPTGAAILYSRDAAERDQPVPPAVSDHAASTGAWASAGDAARFMQMLLNEGTLDGAVLLKPESVRELFATPKEVPEAGLGWFVGDFQGQKSFAHAGSVPGAMAEMRGFPGDKTGVVVLTNSDGHTLTGQIIWAVADALYPAAKAVEEKPTEAPLTDIDAFHGDWTATMDHFSGKIGLTLVIDDEDTAYLRFEDGPMRRLQNFGLIGDEVSGYLWADLPARDDVHAPVKVSLALRKVGERISGTFTTELETLFNLSTYISFSAKPVADQPAEKTK